MLFAGLALSACGAAPREDGDETTATIATAVTHGSRGLIIPVKATNPTASAVLLNLTHHLVKGDEVVIWDTWDHAGSVVAMEKHAKSDLDLPSKGIEVASEIWFRSVWDEPNWPNGLRPHLGAPHVSEVGRMILNYEHCLGCEAGETNPEFYPLSTEHADTIFKSGNHNSTVAGHPFKVIMPGPPGIGWDWPALSDSNHVDAIQFEYQMCTDAIANDTTCSSGGFTLDARNQIRQRYAHLASTAHPILQLSLHNAWNTLGREATIAEVVKALDALDGIAGIDRYFLFNPNQPITGGDCGTDGISQLERFWCHYPYR